MNSKPFISLLLVLCFTMSFSGLCAGEEQKTVLTVEGIGFHRDKDDRERIVLECNQSCVPELSTLEGENLQMIMEVGGVSLSRTTAHNVKIRGKMINRLRSNFDSKTKIFRVAIEMNALKYYIVHPMQDPSGNKYILIISERKPEGSENAKGSSLSQEKRITILRPDLKLEGQEGSLQEAAASPKEGNDMKTAKDVPSVDQGRSQLNAGKFAAAVDTFTQILAANPQDRMSYRLRGNAYDNLGNRQKAVEDWIRAARLGDTILQSYLDFLKVTWRENPTP